MLRHLTALFFLFAPLVPAPLGGAQESCNTGVINRIVVENRSIFAEEDIPEQGRLRWAYLLANRVHIRTREEFIRQSLFLLEEGDCLDPAALAETARLLREYRFLAGAEIAAVEGPGGGWDVHVETRDEWTTKLAVDVHFDDGIRMEGFSLVQENFLGRGATVGVFGLDRDERREAGMTVEVPGVLGSGLDVRSELQRTRIGDAAELAIVRPFRVELPGRAFRHVASYRKDYFSYVLPGHSRYSHAVIPVTEQRLELSAAERFNDPGDLYLLGGGLSLERLEVGPGDELGGVVGRDFSELEMATPEMEQAIANQLRPRRAVRLNLLLGLRKLEFETRQGLDAVAGVQDLAVGREVKMTLGRSLGGTVDGHPQDLFTRLDLFGGRSGGRTVAQLHISGEGRREDSGTASVGWSDLLLESHAFLYWIRDGALSNTWVLRGAVHSGWRTRSPFQLSLGGPDGVRGYDELDFPGAHRTVLSAEGRFRLPGPFSELADFGLTAFGDLGASWAGDAPFGVDSGWRGSLGAGLRIGFPAGSSSVIRADVAFPVGSGASSRSPVIRISAREWIGVTGAFRSPQFERSRGAGIRAEYRGVAREPSIP